MEPFKILSREELYDLVWTVPMRKLAKQFDLSDNGLAKKCKKHNIPRPPLGHWAKVEHGKAVDKPPLPKNTDPLLESIEFYRSPFSHKVVPKGDLLDSQLEKVLAFKIPESVSRYHPLVSKLRRGINKKMKDKYGRLFFKEVSSDLGFKITQNTFDRACLFMHGIIELFDACGWKLKLDGPRDCTAFVCDDVDLTFEIKERVKQVSHENAGKHNVSLFSYPRYDFIPTGILEFSISNLYSPGFKVRWSDSKKSSIENQLVDIVCGFSRAYEYEKQQTIEREKQRLLREREREERRRQYQIEQMAEARRAHLIQLSEQHHKASLVKALISSLQQVEQKPEGLESWLAWAAKESREIDPTENAANIVLAYLDFENKDYGEPNGYYW